jgi:flagellum-specific peptidoglycan hydrolase FlgJ
MEAQIFIDKIAIGAKNTMKQRGILASVSIAQAILESGWGEHSPCNNLFGIKANGWKGAVQTLATTEVIKGKTVHIMDTFRAYPTLEASIEDHGAFLVQNIRYKNIIGQKNFKLACQYLQTDGYSTSPYYAQTLISLIEKYGLNKYDK